MCRSVVYVYCWCRVPRRPRERDRWGV